MDLDVGKIVGRLEMNVQGWTSAVEKVKKDQQSLAEFALRHKESIEKLGKTMTLVGGATVAALGAMVRSTANYGDEINDMSQRTGVAAETLSGFRLAAENSGTSMDGLATGLKFLNKNMYDASTGGKETSEAFAALGVTVQNSDGTLRDTSDVMFDVAGKLSSMDDGAQKTALAMRVFGKSGADLIPMLNLGAEGLRENYERASQFGIVISQDAAKAADEFNDSLGEMKLALTGATREVGTSLMPSVKNLVDKVTAAVVKFREWAAAHPGLIQGLSSVALTMGSILTALGPAVMAVPRLTQGFTALAAVLKTTTAGLGIALAGLTALAAGALMVYNSVTTMTKAAEDAGDAELDMAMKNDKLQSALWKVAKEAGLTREQFNKLKEKYGENSVALQHAISTGKEGAEIQRVLKERHAETTAAVKAQIPELNFQETALKASKAAGEKLGTTMTSLKESLGLTFSIDIISKINDTKTALEQYGDVLLPEEVDRLKLSLETMYAKLYGGIPYMEAVETEYQNLIQAADDWLNDAGEDTEEWIQGWIDASIAAAQANEDLTRNTQTETAAQSTAWEDLVRDITQGWGDAFQQLAQGQLTFKGFLEQTWGALKQYFFRMIADMATQWITEGIAKMVSSAATGAEKTTSAFGSIGTTVVNTAKGIVGAIKEVALAVLEVVEAIGKTVVDIAAYAIETLAKAIAAAIKALAGAVPELVALGLAAAAVYLAFGVAAALVAGLESALTGGGGNSDITDWLKVIHDDFIVYAQAIAGHIIFNGDKLVDLIIRGDQIRDRIDFTRDKLLETLNKIQNYAQGIFGLLNNLLPKMNDFLKTMATTLSNLTGAQEGGISRSTQLMVLHGSPSEPEYIVPHDKLGRFVTGIDSLNRGAAAASNRNVNVSVNIKAWDGTDVERFFRHKGRELIVDMFRRNVGGFSRETALAVARYGG